MIFNSLNVDFAPVWTPVPCTTNDKVLYYNKQLDLYCDQLPLLSNPPLETVTNFTTDDHLVDLNAREVVGSSTHNEKTFKVIPWSTKGTSSSVGNTKTSSLSSSSCTNESPRRSIDSNANVRSGSISTPNSANFCRVVSETSNAAQAISGKPGSVATQAVMSPASRKKPHSWQTSPQRQKKNQKCILSEPDLFYHHTMDVKVWPELRDTTLYYARKAHEMFLKDNRLDFSRYFQLVSTYTAYTQMACRLCSMQPHHKNQLKELKRLLKKSILSLSRLSINSSLYFLYSQRSSVGSHTTPRTSQSQTQLANVSKRSMKNVIGGSSAQTQDAAPFWGQARDSSVEELPAPASASYPMAIGQRNNSAATARTSVPNSADLNEFENERAVLLGNISNNIDFEFSHFTRTLQTLYHLLQFSVARTDWIPQLFPRFFKGSFNGGSWVNPFSQINVSPESRGSLGSATNSAMNPNLASPVGGLPPKVAEAVAQASGYSLQELTDAGQWDSRHSLNKGTMKNARVMQRNAVNRPSHHRTFSRSRAPKIVQYALNENTVNLMRRRFTALNSKLTAMEINNESPSAEEEVKTRRRRVEIISQIYDEVSSTGLLEIMENLNMSIFVNLKKLIEDNKSDTESEEFLGHSLSSISSLLTEFFDIKQAFHDTVISLVMTTQQITLNDPYVFCSMKSNYPVGYFEPGLSFAQVNKADRMALDFYKHLADQDVEINNMRFLSASDDLNDACNNYSEIAYISCSIVEQLVRERENLLNYAARMMKNDLTAALLNGEQDKWFEDYTFFGIHGEEEEGVETIHSDDDEGANFSSIAKDTPWFLTPEHEHDLIYDQRGRIKGGTKDALIEYLTNPEVVDAWFNVTMLLTFRSMFTTRDFLYALAYRYNSHPPEGLSYDEYNLWIEMKLQPIRLRVVGILKSLLSQYWNPAYYEAGVAAALSFAQTAVEDQVPGANDLKNAVREVLANNGKPRADFDTQGTNVQQSSSDTRSNLVTSTMGSNSHSLHNFRKIKLLDIDPRTYASQLTIMEHNQYLCISVFECLDRAWGTKYCDMGGSPNITKFIASANNLTNYVSYAIVKNHDPKMRARLIQYFITVAQYCRELNNFSSMTAIVSALCSSPIYRLKKTWPLVSKESKVFLDEMNTLMDSTKNFINYRELLRSLKNVACVPFFGVFLSDLTFIYGGNPDFLFNSTDIINFSKRARNVEILEGIMSFKKVYYKLKRYDDIQGILTESLSNVPHIEKQYELSLQIEPREEHASHALGRDVIGNTGFRSHAISEDRPGKLFKLGKKKQSSRLFG